MDYFSNFYPISTFAAVYASLGKYLSVLGMASHVPWMAAFRYYHAIVTVLLP